MKQKYVILRDTRKLDVVTFEQFLAQRNIGDEAAVVPLLKEAWNQAVESSSNHISREAVTNHGVRNALMVE